MHLTHKPTIEGERIRLRPFQSEDIPHLKAILTDEEVVTLTGSEDTFHEEVVHDWYNTRNEQADRLDLAIAEKRTNKIVGEVVLNEYQAEDHSMNFRILIGKEGRDQGFGTEATQLFCAYVFEQTDLNALTLSVFDFNPRAKHIYEKIGFKAASVDKNEWQVDGVWFDSINMRLPRKKFNEK